MARPCGTVSSNPSGKMGRAETEPWFKSKKGSVIPAKRRSVKRMMFDQLVQSFASLFGPRLLVQVTVEEDEEYFSSQP